MTTAAQDRAFPSSPDEGLTELKGYLQIDPDDSSDDVILGLALKAGKEAADGFMNNPFEDDDGNPEAIPALVELGILVWAAVESERLSPAITSMKSGGISESYSSPEKATESLGNKYWNQWRLLPGL